MADRGWANIYNLSDAQIQNLDEAEQKMEMHDLSGAEEILLSMLEDDSECIPVLSNLGNLYGKYFSEFEKAVEYYSIVLELEPDNAWARDERRRYQRYSSYELLVYPVLLTQSINGCIRGGNFVHDGTLLIAGVGGLGSIWAKRAHANCSEQCDLLLVDSESFNYLAGNTVDDFYFCPI